MDNQRHKVVLVDDNEATLDQGKSLLQAHYRVLTFQSAALLFEYLENDLPDMILLDVEMPGMSGFEAIEILKANPRYADIPVIFLTAKSDEESERKGFRLGAVDYIAKPFSAPLLQKRISNQILYMRVQNAVKDYSDNLETMVDEVTRANERMKTLFDKMPFSCRLFDKNYNMIDCNEAAVKLFGFKDKKECIEKFKELHPQHQPDGQYSMDKLYMLIKKAFDEGIIIFDWTYKMLDGTFMPAEVTFARMEYEGDYVLAVYTRDLREHEAIESEKRRAEIAEMTSLAKSQFLAMMSHELRTPMNSITGFAELALNVSEDSVQPKIKDYLIKILDSARWFLRIANDILDISKIESGQLELESIPFDLNDIISRCQSVILPDAMEKGIDYRIYMNPFTGIYLAGDPLRLYQVLANLLVNAIKFTEKGTVSLSVSPKKQTDGRVSVYFEIKDTGIGMGEDQLKKLFKPFTQADSSTTRKYGGAGLGLAITKNIIELMGGSLSVQSAVGAGTTFSFEIIFETASASAENPVSKSIEPMEKPVFKGEVLVCDDNPLNQEVIYEHLSQVGLKAVIAANGSEGIQKVRERAENGEPPFDLIFMDIYMPVMDGIEAASQIISLGTKTPIVAMTANIMTSEIKKYIEHGMPDCLSKPFTSGDLWKILLKYIVPVRTVPIISHNPDDDLQKRLKANFVKSNQTIYEDIIEAVNKGDFKLAHRIVHTLKGNAGQIGKKTLQQAAGIAECSLKNGSVPDESVMELIKNEVALLLSELKPLLNECKKTLPPLSTGEMRSLFDALEPLLKQRNTECVDLLDKVHAVPGAEKLARQIEQFDFKLAEQTLSQLKTELGI